MKQIGIIVNSTDMYRIAQEATRSYRDQVEIVLTHAYDESLEWARYLEKKGCRILISRGGHSNRMREANLGIPIVDIPFTGNNIAALMLQASKQFGSFGVLGNRTLLQMARGLEASIGPGVRYLEIRGWNDFERRVAEAREMGLKAIVGGYDATSFAEKAGLCGFCVTTDEFEIGTALHEAQKVLNILDREKRWNETFRAMLDSIREGIILVNEEGVVTHYNQPAKKLISRDKQLELGSPLNDGLLNEKVWGTLRNDTRVTDEIGEGSDLKYTSSISPIRVSDKNVGAIVVLQEVEYVRKIEQFIRQKLAQRGLIARMTFEDILGESRAIRDCILVARQYSKVNSTVLISGESGTGKELFAQSIHNQSARSKEAFVAINCATIPSNLLESELFGYAEGAFTGAKKGGKMGLFELAHNGTIFLDEIGEIGLDMQARLLRVLEERQIMRIGDDRMIPVNIRVIAATNKDLKRLVEEGRFRSDLYYRINVLSITLPPLRERKEDVRVLIGHYLKRYSRQNGSELELSPDGMEALIRYDWPGNVREIKNIVERLSVIYGNQTPVGSREVSSVLTDSQRRRPPAEEREGADPAADSGRLMDRAEKELIRRILRETGGNKTEAARRLGISRVTLYNKLKELDAQAPSADRPETV